MKHFMSNRPQSPQTTPWWASANADLLEGAPEKPSYKAIRQAAGGPPEIDHASHLNRLLGTCEAALHFGLKPQTLREWRTSGSGPRYVRLSRNRVAYRIEDLDEWERSRSFASTSQESEADQRKVPV